jgi:hypothetical protein
MVEDLRGAPDAGPEPMQRSLAVLTAGALTLASAIADAQTAPPSTQQRGRGTILTFTCVPADQPASPLDVNIEPVRQIVFYDHTLRRGQSTATIPARSI